MSSGNAIYTQPSTGMTPEDIRRFMRQGLQRGQELTGATPGEIGSERKDIRDRYRDIVNAPSRGAARVEQARNANLKQLRASQARSGVQGGMADLQRQQIKQNYASTAGNVRQKEYLDALNKLERQFRGAGKDIMAAEGGYGSIAVGGKEIPQPDNDRGFTYICTEIKRRGLATKGEFFAIHLLLFFGTIFRPAQTYHYLKNGMKLVQAMREVLRDVEWITLKQDLMDECLHLMKKGKFLSAVNKYELVVRGLYARCGLSEKIKDIDLSWSVVKLIKSFSLMFKIKFNITRNVLV